MNPFTDPLPSEVTLPRAPLVRVLCQLRFPTILSVEKQEFVVPFQEMLRQAYPVLRQEQTEGLVMGPTGLLPAKAQTAWRFETLAGDWRVSLTSNFISLETTKYTSRHEFIDRLSDVLKAAELHISPAVVDRVGVRYVDRLDGEALSNLTSLIRPEVVGIAAGSLHQLNHSITESTFDTGEEKLLARWGRLPANTTMDPNLMLPVDWASWVLDLDMYSKPGTTVPFKAEEVLSKVRGYAERIHAFFRWCVTDEFLKFYGAE